MSRPSHPPTPQTSHRRQLLVAQPYSTEGGREVELPEGNSRIPHFTGKHKATTQINEECIPWESIRQYTTICLVMTTGSKHVQPLRGPEKAFGQAFRTLRKERGISQERVSFEANCDRTTVSLIERGLVSSKLETIVKMCKAISVFPSAVMRRMEKSRFYR
jgi:DNA-binding XRE family transcriptional regulator